MTPAPPVSPYPELDALLGDLVARARAVLGETFVGAYLQGSFAFGDSDLHSDCDFLVVIDRDPTPVQVAGLRALHAELPTRAGHWCRHLEGSYPVAAELRREAQGATWWYVDHGHTELVRSDHCNRPWVRWTLRERGARPRRPVAGLVSD